MTRCSACEQLMRTAEGRRGVTAAQVVTAGVIVGIPVAIIILVKQLTK